MIFAMLVVLPLTRVFFPSETFAFLVVLGIAIWVVTSGLRFLVVRYFPKIKRWLTPVILIISASCGVYVASFFMPEWVVGRFEFGLFVAYVLSGFLAIALRLAFLKSKEMSKWEPSAVHPSFSIHWMLKPPKSQHVQPQQKVRPLVNEGPYFWAVPVGAVGSPQDCLLPNPSTNKPSQ
jgi:hypothetical protein